MPSIGDFLKYTPAYQAYDKIAKPAVRAIGERTGLVDSQEESDLKKSIQDFRKNLTQQAETGVTPELREYARRAAKARAALGARFSDRRLSPEQRARFLGQAQAQLGGETAAGMAEMQRRGRETAQQQIFNLDTAELARMDAEQARNLNALLAVLETGASLALNK